MTDLHFTDTKCPSCGVKDDVVTDGEGNYLCGTCGWDWSREDG